VVARRLQEARPGLKTIVTLLCDEGEKYISEHFSDAATNGGRT
jgi:cysteine synthase A